MILQLLPEQVADRWDEVGEAIAHSLPTLVDTELEGVMESILEALIGGVMQCWVSFQYGDDGKEVVNGIGTTAVIEDYGSRTRSLLIYSTYSVSQTVDKDWRDAFEGIVKFAESKKCTRIVTYTTNPKIIKNAGYFDGKVEAFISFDVRRFVDLINKGERI